MVSLLAWLEQHTIVLTVLAVVSLCIMLASMAAAPWAVSKLPVDYLINSADQAPARTKTPLWVSVIKNLSGVFLILLGIVMLVAPGPGLIVMLLGLALTRFPGKQALVRLIGRQSAVYQALNWMRARHQQPPLLHPDR